ncbi:phosphotransferase family protein [Gammaproteobacteria bacterium 45_16_T64]|nr:phosphotransferase family protein [Gammaproteobacteria bacterium 45_16_T64]
MTVIDQAGTIRDGEELNNATINAYVKQQVSDIDGDLTITQFPGGASNLTYALSFPNKELILRRPPFGTIAKSAHDMGREYKVMDKLKPHYPYVPTMVSFCDDESIIGCDFYLMERLVGIIPRSEMPKALTLDESQTRELCTNVVDKFIELHQVDYVASDLADLGKGDGYVERQISGWSTRYRNAKTDNVPDFEGVMSWLNSNMPAQVKVCIIHNDFRFDNVVLNPDNPTEVIGVLDWEMATLGDPLMDLGNSLAYWIQADDDPVLQMTRRQPTHLPGMMTRQEVVDYYCDKMGFQCDDFTFYRVYGLFRLAGIIQQIYYRFHHGQTKDKRFANFFMMVAHLEKLCLGLIGK